MDIKFVNISIIFLEIVHYFFNNALFFAYNTFYFSHYFNVAACKFLRVNVMHLNNYRGTCLHFWHGKYRHYGTKNHLDGEENVATSFGALAIAEAHFKR